jgi:hypothetical protein
MLAHQPLDAMQSGIQTFGQNVVPDPTCTIGAVAAGKARTDPREENLNAVALQLNTRPRKTLGFQTSADMLVEPLR